MPKLRIVSVNDVYALENLPRLKNLIAHHRSLSSAGSNEAFIAVLAGDFLAPSLLSSLDAGRGMVDCLNAVGLTHIILGNHEDDLPAEELRARLTELTVTCLGTNIHGGLGDLPRRDVVHVADRLDVGLVGVVMVDSGVYRGKPFGGADLSDANRAATEEATAIIREGVAKHVVAITHQSIASDRLLAAVRREDRPSEPLMTVIVGGHEHTPMLVHADDVWIVKAGSEAAQAVITELVWDQDIDARPMVTTRLEPVGGYPEDAALRTRVDRHMAAVRELSSATLLYVQGAPLSSVGTRSMQTSIGTLICSRLRDALDADACLFNGGGIRAQRVYPKRVTYGDVEAEVPFDNEVVVVKMKGSVIREAVQVSRAKAPAEWGAFLQVDDRMIVEPKTNLVLTVNGSPIDPEREYDVAIVRELLLGLDGVEPLTRWAKENPSRVPPAGCGREPKMVLVQAFALAIWRELGGFDAVDTNKDDRVTATEIAAAVVRAHPPRRPLTFSPT